MQRDNELITAEDDQEFLSRLQLTLTRAASPSRTVSGFFPCFRERNFAHCSMMHRRKMSHQFSHEIR